MSVSKSKVTNSILKSEKKSLFRFLTLYFVMITVMMLSLGLYYYDTQKQITLAQYKATLSKYAYVHIKKLKALHHYFPQERQYPRSDKYTSAIYDIDKKPIFSLLNQPNVNFETDIYIKDGYIHYIKTLDTYYLGTRYLILEVLDDEEWFARLYKKLLLYAFISFIVFGLLGLFLAHLFIKPLRDSVMLLDRFIKDTTHELNTPLSTILANIEMMDREVMAKKNLKKLDRINSAAKSVSVLYKDLTYLTLEQHKNSNDEEINLKELTEERCEYFDILAKSKNVTFELDLQDTYIVIDRNKITRVIDNLISNAIKYNKRNGTIQIKTQANSLIIKDSGIGIDKEQIPYMFDRYMRFDSSEGGFGVGLSIVKNIIDEYSMDISVTSELNQGTRIEIKWQN
jgi:two-component system OmpR family sensor kinase